MKYLCVEDRLVHAHPHLMTLLDPIINLRRLGPGNSYYAVPENHPNIEFILIIANQAGWVSIDAELPTIALRTPAV
jgi:hypothetical protein